MNNKFEGIITEENMQVVTSVMSVVEVAEKSKINLIETIANVVYCHEDHFNTLTLDEKIKAITMVALTFNMLLDEDINPFAKKHITLGVNAFNNNIFAAGGLSYGTN